MRLAASLRGALCAVAMVITGSGGASAQGVPVIDASAIAQMLTEYSEMLTQSGIMNEDLRQQITMVQQGLDRFQQLQTQIGAITGSRDLAGLLENIQGLELDMVLPMGAMGNGVSDTSLRLGELIEQDELQAGPALWGDDDDEPRRDRESYVMARHQSYMMLASAETMLEGAEQFEEAYATLIEQIDQTDDIKASLDLNARIAAENGRTLVRLTHMLSIMALREASRDRMEYARFEQQGVFDTDAVRSYADQIGD